MEELHQKYSNLFRENEDLKLRIKYLEMRLEQNEKENGRCTNCHGNSYRENEIDKKTAREENMKHKIIEDENNDPQILEISSLKNEICKYKTLAHNLIEKQKIINKTVNSVLGYELHISENNKKITARSMYSFDENDCVDFLMNETRFDFIPNEFTDTYSKEIDQFIIKGKSVSAFLAHVTLDLFGQTTFQ